MTTLDDIILMNETKIIYRKNKNIDYRRNQIVKKILEDESCFFKIKKEDAYMILNDIGINKNVDKVYSDLISKNIYYELYNKGKIKKDDPNILIKYKPYDSNDLFKNNKEKIYYDINKVENNYINDKGETLFSKFRRILIGNK